MKGELWCTLCRVFVQAILRDRHSLSNKIAIRSWLIHSSTYYLWLIPDELASCMAPGF